MISSASREVVPAWIRSTRCESSHCVEAAVIEGRIGLRDSKDAEGPILTVSRGAWAEFTSAIRAGTFSR